MFVSDTRPAYTNNHTLGMFAPVLCEENQRVVSNLCEACPSGKGSGGGDDSSRALG